MYTRDVTMRDVAVRAGVAASTVSRVLTTPDRIAPETRERVFRAIRELGYARPVPKRNRAGSVAMLVADITNPFFFDIVRGSQDVLRAAGFTQLLIDTDGSPQVEEASLEDILDNAVGVILAAPRLDANVIRGAAARQPLVCINRPTPGVPGVELTTAAALVDAVEHLASLGHRRICYLHGPRNSWSDAERWRSCAQACERLEIDAIEVGPYDPSMTGGRAAADAALNTGSTAAIAFNDLMAIGMLQRFRDRGVSVPDQFSVVGCDDIFGADFCDPPITTLSVPLRAAGRLATTMLLEQLGVSGRAPSRRTTLPAHLTIRSSTGPV